MEAAGGLLLLVVALDLLRGQVEGLSGEGKINVAFVPLGTPLLAGPWGDRGDHGIHARGQHGGRAGRGRRRAGRRPGRAVADPAVRGVVRRLLGQAGIKLITRMSGLLLTAIAVQLVADAILEFAREGA